MRGAVAPEEGAMTRLLPAIAAAIALAPELASAQYPARRVRMAARYAKVVKDAGLKID
jgi:hypothetical protein